MNKIQNTKLKVSNDRGSMELEIPWDADIEDWVNVFKTVLIHQTFSEDTVKELFEDPWLEYEKAVSERNEVEYQSKPITKTDPWWNEPLP